MITAQDLWAALAAGSPTARVTVRTAGGEEVDVANVCCYGQLVVICTDEPLHAADETYEAALPDVAETVTPEQITELLDAHSGDIQVCTGLLEELEERGVTTRKQLIDVLNLAAGLDDLDDHYLDDQDMLT